MLQLSKLWFCKKCTLNHGKDCGSWDEQNEYFSNIQHTHKNCPGFQTGKPHLRGKENWGYTEIEKEATKVFNENIGELFHELIVSLKGSEKVCLIKDKWKWVNQT
jgi:hypothetical protein